MKCKTKYPLFLIHGTGFRDRKYLNYWGRIPKRLEESGAIVYYGNQDSWGSVEGNALILRDNLYALKKTYDFDKVNIIAHSKGGLEARYLASELGCASMIASITTISTPHHGSKTMDVLNRLPAPLFTLAGFFVNLFCRICGDKKPDFAHACRQFTTGYAAQFNTNHPDTPGIYCQSYATAMHNSRSDLLLCLPHLIIKKIEGENDGLVTVSSARWGAFQEIWYSCSRRGISHADSVDLRRKPFSKANTGEGIADITDAYLELVQHLRDKGY